MQHYTSYISIPVFKTLHFDIESEPIKKLGKRKNITMAISDSVQGKISINFENVTFEVALKHHTFSQRAVHATLIKKRQSNNIGKRKHGKNQY